MTKKDFILIAATLNMLRPAFDDLCVNVPAHAFADALATTNPRFDRARFLTACGVQS